MVKLRTYCTVSFKMFISASKSEMRLFQVYRNACPALKTALMPKVNVVACNNVSPCCDTLVSEVKLLNACIFIQWLCIFIQWLSWAIHVVVFMQEFVKRSSQADFEHNFVLLL